MPVIGDAGEFARGLFDSGRWVDAIDAIRARHGLREAFVQSRLGSTVVFLSPRHCIKLFAPLPGFHASHLREVAALRCVAGRLPIATPEVCADDVLEGWTYYVATRLPGQPIDAVWDELDARARLRLAAALGEAIGQLHRVDGSPVAAVTEPWAEFRPAQRARCLDQERSKGLPADRLAELEVYLRRLDEIPEPSPLPALLHTEIGPSHVLVDDGRLTGLIDFGDAMVGDPEYDLAPVGMFVTRGDAAAFRAFGEAYGSDADALRDPARPRRLLRHALLHRYATLAWYLDVLRPPAGSLDELAAFWFGVA